MEEQRNHIGRERKELKYVKKESKTMLGARKDDADHIVCMGLRPLQFPPLV